MIFTDLVALLLTFFVMLFSMSSVKIDRWTEMIDALTTTLNPARTEETKVPTAKYNISTEFRRAAINLNYLNAVIGEKIIADPFLSQGRLVPFEDRLIISFPGHLLFAPDRAELLAAAGEALFNLGGILRLVDNQVTINGYVSTGSAAQNEYASEWELSLARAVVVANAFRRAGYDEDILTFGYGTVNPAELEGYSEAVRRSLAQRVDIVLLSASNNR